MSVLKCTKYHKYKSYRKSVKNSKSHHRAKENEGIRGNCATSWFRVRKNPPSDIQHKLWFWYGNNQLFLKNSNTEINSSYENAITKSNTKISCMKMIGVFWHLILFNSFVEYLNILGENSQPEKHVSWLRQIIRTINNTQRQWYMNTSIPIPCNIHFKKWEFTECK